MSQHQHRSLELPPVGEVPAKMLAQVVRRNRFGEPAAAFVVEEIETPSPGPGEVLIGVMAAGINYNNVWAARGLPIDVIGVRQKEGEPYDFHVGGSDCSGIVYAVGEGVTDVGVGDEVVTHPGWWAANDPWIAAGKDPMLAPSAAIWGYNTNFGSFGQFCLAKKHQVMPRPQRLTWEEAAASTLVGTTAYRMLYGWAGNTVGADDFVLVWGGSGGVGAQAIQIAKAAGAAVVAVVSENDRGEFCLQLGADGFVNRNDFDHWSVPPHWEDSEGQKNWSAGARAFGSAVWDAVGERRNPTIVVEHPGEATIPTSIFVCETGGMVVICAGTTGYTAVVDLRYHWVRQKRLQGSHGTNTLQALEYNEMISTGSIGPAMGQVYSFEDIGQAHQDMADGVDVRGNRVALVGASRVGLGAHDG